MTDRNITPLPDLAPGGSNSRAPQLIAGRYKVVGKLGQGGMGRVYKCQDAVLERLVAVKLVNRNLEEQYFARFHQEAKAASQLNHHNILHVLDFGLTEDRQPYMVMELVTGETLDEILKRLGSFSLLEAIEIVSTVCLGMQHAHSQGVVHRDLKTSNIMLAKRGEHATIPLILDFGIAKMINSPDDKGMLTKTGEIMGSPRYMSPEQAAGHEVDGRSDIYSLGCVLFEMLTGQPPFDADNAMETIYMHLKDKPPRLSDRSKIHFPDQLEEIISKLLEKNPANRFSTMEELHDELSRAQSVFEEVRPATASSATQAQRKSNSATILLISVAIALITIAVAGVLFYVFEPSPPSLERSSLDVSHIIFEGTPVKHFDTSKNRVLRKHGAPQFNGFGITDLTGLMKVIASRHKPNSFNLSEGKIDKEMMQYLLSQKEIDRLTFSNVAVSQDAQKLLFTNPRIRSLQWNGPIDKPILVNLDKMSGLTELQIAHADLGDEDIPNIMRAQHLRELSLDRNRQLTGTALATLSRLQELKDLNVGGIDMTNEELVQLAGLTSLTALDISSNPALNSAGVLHFWKQRKKKTPLKLYAVSCRQLPEAVQQQIHKVIPDIDLHSTHNNGDILGENALQGMLDYGSKEDLSN